MELVTGTNAVLVLAKFEETADIWTEDDDDDIGIIILGIDWVGVSLKLLGVPLPNIKDT